MNHLGFLAIAYLTLVLFGVPSPSKELYLALAYLLCCYEIEIASALDPTTVRRRLTALALRLREVITSAGFAWRWRR